MLHVSVCCAATDLLTRIKEDMKVRCGIHATGWGVLGVVWVVPAKFRTAPGDLYGIGMWWHVATPSIAPFACGAGCHEDP